MSERVDEAAGLQEITKRLPLLWSESRLLDLLGVEDVDGLMGHVEVAAENDRLAQIDFELRLQEVLEVFVPLVHSVVQSLEALDP